MKQTLTNLRNPRNLLLVESPADVRIIGGYTDRIGW
jgi:hypothetical protein